MFYRRTIFLYRGKEKVCAGPVAQTTGSYPSFCNLKQQEYVNSPLDGLLMHWRVFPQHKFASTHLYTWVERGTVSQEQNAVTLTQRRALTGLMLNTKSSELTIRSLHLFERGERFCVTHKMKIINKDLVT